MINGIRIKNLRSLVDTGDIQLRPITLLVGKNSAGKSTFARSFPLVRQSIEEQTIGPILWYGRLVDFGDFETSKSRLSETNNIEFSFDFDIDKKDLNQHIYQRSIRAFRGRLRSWNDSSQPHKAKLNICMGYDDSTYISNINLKIFDFDCNLITSKNTVESIIVNNNIVWQKTDDLRCDIIHRNGLLPEFYFKKRRRIQQDTNEKISTWERHDPFKLSLYNAVSMLVNSNTGSDRIYEIMGKLSLSSIDDFTGEIKNIRGAPLSWNSSVKRFTSKSPSLLNLYRHVFTDNIILLLDYLNENIYRYYSNIRYIEPLRATAQRYYRGQELAVNEIDSKGANVAFFLDSLNASQKESFNQWMVSNLGISLIAEKEGGHIALKVKDIESNEKTNIADIGFGFSQMLPIVVQLWQATLNSSTKRHRRLGNDITLVMEQPELHLHPEYQSRIADIVAKVILLNTKHANTRIIIETHSPSIVNRIGQLISEQTIGTDDVSVLLFEQDQSGETKIRNSKYDVQGVLLDWPYGFFDH